MVRAKAGTVDPRLSYSVRVYRTSLSIKWIKNCSKSMQPIKNVFITNSKIELYRSKQSYLFVISRMIRRE